MAEINYKKILKTRSHPESKIQKEKDRKRKLALEIVMIQDKELLKLLAK
jgi:hypothetical protein